MHNWLTIVGSLQEGQEVLNIARNAVGLGSHKGVTDNMISVGGQKMEYAILNFDIDKNWKKILLQTTNE
jgi:hypothetical protein